MANRPFVATLNWSTTKRMYHHIKNNRFRILVALLVAVGGMAWIKNPLILLVIGLLVRKRFPLIQVEFNNLKINVGQKR